jgi:hypothetical protein
MVLKLNVRNRQLVFQRKLKFYSFSCQKLLKIKQIKNMYVVVDWLVFGLYQNKLSVESLILS